MCGFPRTPIQLSFLDITSCLFWGFGYCYFRGSIGTFRVHKQAIWITGRLINDVIEAGMKETDRAGIYSALYIIGKDRERWT